MNKIKVIAIIYGCGPQSIDEVTEEDIESVILLNIENSVYYPGNEDINEVVSDFVSKNYGNRCFEYYEIEDEINLKQGE